MHWRFGIILALLMTSLLGEEKVADWKEERRRLSEKATLAFGKADWQEARHLYHKILEQEPDNAMILANLGAVEYQLGDYTACCDYLESALKGREDLVASREMLGMAYHLNKKPLRAVSALTRAVADEPESPRAHNQLAVILQAMAWYDGAEKSLLQAIKLDPDYRDAHFNLALIYLDRNSPSLKLARKHYDKAIQLGVKADKDLEKRLKR